MKFLEITLRLKATSRASVQCSRLVVFDIEYMKAPIKLSVSDCRQSAGGYFSLGFDLATLASARHEPRVEDARALQFAPMERARARHTPRRGRTEAHGPYSWILMHGRHRDYEYSTGYTRHGRTRIHYSFPQRHRPGLPRQNRAGRGGQ